MSAAAAARSAARSAAFRISSSAKPKAPPSRFRIPTQKPISSRIFRSPVEMTSFCVESMLPYHTATASALLNSMLSSAPRRYGWTLEGTYKPPLRLMGLTDSSFGNNRSGNMGQVAYIRPSKTP